MAKADEELQRLNETLRGLNDSIRRSTKQETLTSRNLQNLRAGLPAFFMQPMQALQGVIVNELVVSIREFGDTFQRQSLQFGMSVREVANLSGKYTDHIGGFTNTMASRLSMLDNGLRGYGKEVGLLTTRAAALRGDAQGVAKFLRRLTLNLALNSNAVGEVAENTRQLSNTFGISAERLIAAEEGLNPSVRSLAGFMGG